MENLSVRSARLLKWGLRTLLIVAIVSGLALFALLVWSADNASRFARQTDGLLLLNGVLAVALMVWVLVMALRLARQIRRHQFGARLTGRFARAFVLVGLLPGLIVYLLSVQFMSRSIESWFNVRVDNALEAGLSLGRAALDNQLGDLTRRVQAAARQLGQGLGTSPDPNASLGTDIDPGAVLLQLRESTQADETMIFTGSGRPLVFSSSRYGQLVPESPPAHVLNQLRVARLYAQAEEELAGNGRGAGRLNLRVVVPIPSPAPAAPATVPTTTGLSTPSATLSDSRSASLSAGGTETRWLQAIQPVSEEVARNASLVQQGFSDYQELALSRLGLRKLYGITLTLALVLSIFAAIMAALTLSRRLVRPLLRLAAGTQAVAVGDYRPLPQPPAKDELGQLTRSFNAMTRQLDEARRMVEANRLQLERNNVYLESVLGNLSSGVLVFDADWHLLLGNQGAQNILQVDLQTAKGGPLHRLPATRAFERHIRQAFETHEAFGNIGDGVENRAAQVRRPYWQQQFELHTHPEENYGASPGSHPATAHVTTLLARGSRLELATEHGTEPCNGAGRDGRSSGYLVVFDDISEVISANRAVAWADVGRRLAHEIKNPLTPIQLSAERLAHKLAHRLAPDEADMLQRSTRTIVNQVTALKKMVDEFREYARTPPLQWQPVCLNALVAEVLALYGWEETHNEQEKDAAFTGVRFHTDLQDGLPDLAGDASQLRQVLHNLFANARDAVQAAGNRAPGRIEVQTRRVDTAGYGTGHSAGHSTGNPGSKMAVRLTVSDNGAGFDAQVLARVFEPYITTKAAGTGLGLAIVRKIVEGHGGRIDVSNLGMGGGGGARVSILFTRFAQTLATMNDNIAAAAGAGAGDNAVVDSLANSVAGSIQGSAQA